MVANVVIHLMLMYGKEASNRKQEIDRQHHTIPNVRFAMALGYEGYPEFQKALGELVRTKLNSIQRMEVTYGRISQGEILSTVLRSDIDKIKSHRVYYKWKNGINQ